MQESGRATGLRALLASAVGIVALLGGVAVASAFALPFGFRLVLALAGFAGYVCLVGSALDERFRLDRSWRHEPPSRGSGGATATSGRRPVPRPILKLDARDDETTAPLFDGPVPGGGKEIQVPAFLGAVATF